MIQVIRRLAIPIAVTSLVVNGIIFVLSCVLWIAAIKYKWVDSVAFVSHVSMMALVFSGITGIAAGLAGIMALLPIDDNLVDD